jgi:hypothetical protein
MKKSELKQLIKEVYQELNESKYIIPDELKRIARNKNTKKSIKEFRSYSGDPIWIRAKFAGKDMYGTSFKKGEEILYYPRQPRGKNIIAGKKAEQEYRNFVAAAEDEDIYMSQYGDNRY